MCPLKTNNSENANFHRLSRISQQLPYNENEGLLIHPEFKHYQVLLHIQSRKCKEKMITYKIRHKWKLDLYKLQQFAIVFVYKTKNSINKTQRTSIRHWQVERKKPEWAKNLTHSVSTGEVFELVRPQRYWELSKQI